MNSALRLFAMLPASGNPLYYIEDMLGTSRVVTSNAGVVCYDADFYPYGGERSYTNTCPQNSYKFEGKERDTETGNDDFGARYCSNRFGRWLSADWSAVPAPVPYANFSNPQTLNLYAMVSDDPESFADLDGHYGPTHQDALMPGPNDVLDGAPIFSLSDPEPETVRERHQQQAQNHRHPSRSQNQNHQIVSQEVNLHVSSSTRLQAYDPVVTILRTCTMPE